MASMFDIEGLSDAKSFGDGADLYSTVEEVFSGGNSLIVQPEPFTHKKIYVDLDNKYNFQIELKDLDGYNGNIDIHLDNTRGVTGIIDHAINVSIKGGTLSQPSTLKVVAGTSYMLTAKYSDGSCTIDYKTDISAPPPQFPLDVDITIEFYNNTREEYIKNRDLKITNIDKYPYSIPIPDLGENTTNRNCSSANGHGGRIDVDVIGDNITIYGIRHPEGKFSMSMNYEEHGALLRIQYLDISDHSEIRIDERTLVSNHKTCVKPLFPEEYSIVEIRPHFDFDGKISVEPDDKEFGFWIISRDIALTDHYLIDVLLERL